MKGEQSSEMHREHLQSQRNQSQTHSNLLKNASGTQFNVLKLLEKQEKQRNVLTRT